MVLVLLLPGAISLGGQGEDAVAAMQSVYNVPADYHQPKNFIAIPRAGYVELNWTLDSPQEVMVVRSDDLHVSSGSGSSGIAEVPAGTSSYIDHDVVAGGMYVYNLEPWGTYLSDYRMVELGGGVPGAPRELRAESSLAGINLTWQIPLEEGGTGVKGFNVRRAVDGGDFSPLASTSRDDGLLHDGLSCSWFNTNIFVIRDTNVSSAHLYRYKVSAVNELGEGEGSDAVSSSPAPGPSITEVKVIQSSCGTDVLELRWAIQPSGRAVSQFKVHYYPFDWDYHSGKERMTYLDSEVVRTVDPSTTSTRLELRADQFIAFRVSAVYEDGTEAFSGYARANVGWCEGIGYGPAELLVYIALALLVVAMVAILVLVMRGKT